MKRREKIGTIRKKYLGKPGKFESKQSNNRLNNSGFKIRWIFFFLIISARI